MDDLKGAPAAAAARPNPTQTRKKPKGRISTLQGADVFGAKRERESLARHESPALRELPCASGPKKKIGYAGFSLSQLGEGCVFQAIRLDPQG